MDKYEVIIIGSGPAGLTAALYTARGGLKTLVLGGYTYGGQLMNTTVIENFPGFVDGIDGPVLMDNMLKQVQRFGALVEFVDATAIEIEGDDYVVRTHDKQYTTSAVIIATGATPKRLNVPGEAELYGRGVSTCATCDGALYKDKVVAVVGGGDSAMEEATYLTHHASKVYLIHRRDKFRASKIMADRVANDPKIEVVWNTEVKEIVGKENKLSHAVLFNNQENRTYDQPLDGFFLAIGHEPVTAFLGGTIKLTDKGYVDSADGIHTSRPGIFVCGDVQDQVYRQAITAAGMGCRAALETIKYLEMKEVV